MSSVKITLAVALGTILGATNAAANCGPWDGTPACVENNRYGVGAIDLHSFGEGYAVCFHGEGEVCRGGNWITDYAKNCVGQSDDPSPMKPTDRPCSTTNAEPAAGQQIGTQIGTPLGSEDSEPSFQTSPPRPNIGVVPNSMRTNNLPSCSQIQNYIQQIEANCSAMSVGGRCANAGKLSLINQLRSQPCR